MDKKVMPSTAGEERSLAYQKFDFVRTQMGFLEGKLLTVVDASYSDREQRDAVKSLVKKVVREQFDHIIECLVTQECGGSTLGNEVA